MVGLSMSRSTINDSLNEQQVNLTLDMVEQSSGVPVRSYLQQYSMNTQGPDITMQKGGYTSPSPSDAQFQRIAGSGYGMDRTSYVDRDPATGKITKTKIGDWDLATDADKAADKAYLAEKIAAEDWKGKFGQALSGMKWQEDQVSHLPTKQHSVRISGDYTPEFQSPKMNNLQSAITGRNKALLGLTRADD